MSNDSISRLKERIAALPPGGITYKTIKGHAYPYYQWREDGRQRCRVLREHEVEPLAAEIAERKEYEQLLRLATYYSEAFSVEKKTAYDAYDTAVSLQPYRVAEDSDAAKFGAGLGSLPLVVRSGEGLRSYSEKVKGWKKRGCYERLRAFVFDEESERVLVLCGLRRTGKTTMIRQVIGDLSEEMCAKAAVVQVLPGCRMAHVNRAMQQLERDGVRYVFFDEVTLVEDFLEGAALLSDVYAANGMKIVLCGTDSLGLTLAEDEELYDRCEVIHTTHISYGEFERVLGVHGIDEYIRYGGTMSRSGLLYNGEAAFASEKSAEEYVDSAIAKNIQHSLERYNYGRHLAALRQMHERGELTGAINRVVEDINHAFTLEVLTRPWYSHDLRVSASNLRKDRQKPTDILDRVDTETITARLREMLEIRNKDEMSVEITDAHRRLIREYLDLLGLTVDVPVVSEADYNLRGNRVVITQPGLRYAQAKALIEKLMMDDTFRAVSADERNRITERILEEVRGRMMEEIVLLETQEARKDAEVFTMHFPVGEFDMVVWYRERNQCEIFEIKHSDKRDAMQRRHLADEKLCAKVRHRYGEISARTVLYRGEDAVEDGIAYKNVEEYLKELPQ